MTLNERHNDTDIVRRVADGDEKAFTELFYTYYNRLGSFVQTLTRNREVTEEIVQEVFTKIWIDRKSLPEVKRFDSYLFVVCRNHALNHIRRIVTERGKAEAYLAEMETIQPAFESKYRKDQYDLIDQAVKLLPSRQQQVFALRRQGFKNPEISEKMHLTVDSVKKYQHLAIKFISEFVKK